MNRGERSVVVTVALAAFASPVLRGADVAERAGATMEGTVARYKRRTGELVLQTGRTRRRLHANRMTPITCNGKQARHEWVVRGVPVRVTLSELHGRKRGIRQTHGRDAVASIEILTAHVSGRILSIARGGRFRVARDAAPASQPAATQPTSAPARKLRRRRYRRTSSQYLTTVTGTVVTRQTKRSSFSRLQRGQRVEVTYIPAGRHPMAVVIDVVGDSKASERSAVRIHIGPDGRVETRRPEDPREPSERSKHDDSRAPKHGR